MKDLSSARFPVSITRSQQEASGGAEEAGFWDEELRFSYETLHSKGWI
jgi:hypothetical protein